MEVMNDNEKQFNQKTLMSGFWYVFSEILVRGFSFFATPIYTRLLSKEVFGNVRVFESWILILVPVISLSLYNSVERAKLDFKEKYDSYISSIVTLMLILFSVVTLLLLVWKDEVENLLSFSDSMFWIFMPYGCAYVCILCMQKRERQMLNYKSNILISILSVIPSVTLSIALLAKHQGSTDSALLTDIRILGFYGPLVFLGIGIAGIIYYRGKTIINLEYWRYGIRFSLPLIIYAVSAQVLYQSDKIMIQGISGKSLAGIYSLATTIVYIVDILSNALQGAWMPWLFQKLDIGKTKEIRKVWLLMFAGMAILSWSIVMLGPEIVWFLGGDGYEEAKWLLGSMLSAGVFQFVMLLFLALEKFYKKTSYSGWAGVISACVNIGLNWVCINSFGYQAAAYTTTVSYLVAVMVHYVLMRKCLVRGTVPIKYLVLLCLCVWFLNMASMLLYYLPLYVRIGTLLLVALLLCFLAKEKIIGLAYMVMKEKRGKF